MPTTYDVRVWKIEARERATVTTYRVVWRVDIERRRQTFRTRALAESFHAELVRATRRGEAFDTDTGLPVSAGRARSAVSWYSFACSYADMKWPNAAGKYRKSIAEALTTITFAMLATDRGKPDDKVLRLALRRFAFNTKSRGAGSIPSEMAGALRWVERNTSPVATLAEPVKLRAVLDAISLRLDGRPAAPNTTNRKRMVLVNALTYAVELKYLERHPIGDVQWTPPKTSTAVDRRCVVNPVQARTLLNAVGEQLRTGPHLVAFFALLYFAGLRPEEAANVRVHNLRLPRSGWGEVDLERATPDTGKDWTDSGEQRDERRLKHRGAGEVRTVPLVPELVAILRRHLDTYGSDAQGRLFRAANGGELRTNTYTSIWKRARAAAFTPEVLRSPLARRPYDLRHACVSTWLNGGVSSTQVAEWAGHSVQVLLRVYAKCLDGQQQAARLRVEAALGY